MRVSNWSWKEADKVIGRASHERVKKAAEVIADQARAYCPVGTVSRPMYRGDAPWTARDAGQLKRSIRVVEKEGEKFSRVLAQFSSFGNYGNVRVYAGHFLAYYARIVEYYSPFMRPALESTRGQVKDILENG